MTQARPPLPPYRVLDLTDEKGFLCGRILGDLGMDVIKVEPPGGDPARRRSPFYHDQATPETSLHWFAYNTNKRSVTLHLEHQDGRAIFRRLASAADFVLETFPPGHMESLGLGFQALLQGNPRLVMTSITAFGQDGPRRDYRADDFVAQAAGGVMNVCGDPDREPLQLGFRAAYALAGAQAAVGTLLAHRQRLQTGRGRHVDVSMQEAVMNSLLTTQQFWHLEQKLQQRGRREYGGRESRDSFPVKDGTAIFQIFFGKGPGGRMRSMAKWMADSGYTSDFQKVDFNQVTGFSITQEQLDHWEDEVQGFLSRFTKAEAYQEALKRRVFLMPVSTPKDLAQNEQLRARQFFRPVEHPELGTAVTYPGPFCAFSETPMEIRRRPPLVGEHNTEVYQHDLGLSLEELRTLREAGAI